MKMMIVLLLSVISCSAFAGRLLNKDTNETIEFRVLSDSDKHVLLVDGTNCGEKIVKHEIISDAEALKIEDSDESYVHIGLTDGVLELNLSNPHPIFRMRDLKKVFPALDSDAVVEVSNKRFKKIKITLKKFSLI